MNSQCTHQECQEPAVYWHGSTAEPHCLRHAQELLVPSQEKTSADEAAELKTSLEALYEAYKFSLDQALQSFNQQSALMHEVNAAIQRCRDRVWTLNKACTELETMLKKRLNNERVDSTRLDLSQLRAPSICSQFPNFGLESPLIVQYVIQLGQEQANPSSMESFFVKALAIQSRVGNVVEQVKVCEQIGSLYESMDYFDFAIKYFRKAADVWVTDSSQLPKHAASLMRIGEILLKMGKVTEATVTFSQALSKYLALGNVEQVINTLFRRAEAEQAQDAKKEALATLTEVIRMTQAKPEAKRKAYLQKASLFLSLKRGAEALKMYQAAQSLFSEPDVEIQLGIAESHYQVEQHKHALQVLFGLYALNDVQQDPKLKVHILDRMGACYLSMKRYSEAANAYQSALNILAPLEGEDSSQYLRIRQWLIISLSSLPQAEP